MLHYHQPSTEFMIICFMAYFQDVDVIHRVRLIHGWFDVDELYVYLEGEGESDACKVESLAY